MAQKYYKNSLKFSVLARIRKNTGHVILRKNVEDMGSSRQISRCLNDLIAMGELIRIGKGVYVKAVKSSYLGQAIIPASFDQVCKEALTKLGVKWDPCSAEQAYNAGLSTQVPVRAMVQLKSRFRGKLAYNGRKLVVEKSINAK